MKWKKKMPIMDFVKLKTAKQIYGCPLGGIGTGSIGRGFRGEFCRFQLRPGIYEYITIPEDQFIVNIKNGKNETIFQSVLSTYMKPKKSPASWEWKIDKSNCEYVALYPRAWTIYDLKQYGIKLICKQISPVIPHNYKDSSLPCAVFVWDVINISKETRTVSITFTFRNYPNLKGNHQNENIIFERYSNTHTCGVSMEQKIDNMPCTFTISKTKQTTDSISDGFCKFNVKKTSDFIWNSLESKGRLTPIEMSAEKYPPDAMGLSSQITLEPNSKDKMEFCLVWDMPIIHFGSNTRKYNRYYTRFFGSDGIAGSSIASYALLTYKKWEDDIKEWQEPILEDKNLPDWYKVALMNELYYISDGGSVWLDVADQYPRDDPRWLYGMFGYLEGHEYRMYNTYDVHFYASFALAQLWPHLQVSLQYQFRDSVISEITTRQKMLYCGKNNPRKILNSVPHDLGDPEEEPFILHNAYNIHDVSGWRDLNLKFILQVARDLKLLKIHKQQRDDLDRYQSLEYIDEDVDEEEDLYIRSTNQDIDEVFNNLKKNIALQNKSNKTNGICRHSENEVIVNKTGSRIKYISISSNDYMDDDLTYMKHVNILRQNSNPYVLNNQYTESMSENEMEIFDSERYLHDMYPICRKLIDIILTWDKDNDGLIENTGNPDQTFDAWTMSGPSAYCGGLWLATIQCMLSMAESLAIQHDIIFFKSLLEKAKNSFETKLWNGKYYKFDERNNTIMADQLCGHWYLRACGFHHSIFPKENVISSLNTIYEHNVKKFGKGVMGAVNGYKPTSGDKPGEVDKSSIQSEESWTGVTYGVAALMLHEGMTEEAFKTAGGMFNSLIDMGMSFETPEAIYEDGKYRSLGYMRPLAIWAMQHAINMSLHSDKR